MRWGKGVPALVSRPGLIVDIEDARDSLLLQPLLDVPLVDPGPGCELRGCRGPPFSQVPVQPQPVADVDGNDVHRSECRLEEPSHQGSCSVLIGLSLVDPRHLFHRHPSPLSIRRVLTLPEPSVVPPSHLVPDRSSATAKRAWKPRRMYLALIWNMIRLMPGARRILGAPVRRVSSWV